MVSCSAFAYPVLGMVLAVTSRPDRGGQVAGNRVQCGAVGLTGLRPLTFTIRSPGVVVDALHPSAGNGRRRTPLGQPATETLSPDRRVSTVTCVTSQCMENVGIVDDLMVALVWMTFPTPFPQPDPLPPDPITPVEPRPLPPIPTPIDPEPAPPL